MIPQNQDFTFLSVVNIVLLAKAKPFYLKRKHYFGSFFALSFKRLYFYKKCCQKKERFSYLDELHNVEEDRSKFVFFVINRDLSAAFIFIFVGVVRIYCTLAAESW